MSKLRMYLGDAVYADYDGYHVVLTTEDGYRATNTIYLDSNVLHCLEVFLHDLEKHKTGPLRDGPSGTPDGDLEGGFIGDHLREKE